jgi:hypothetical protein
MRARSLGLVLLGACSVVGVPAAFAAPSLLRASGASSEAGASAAAPSGTVWIEPGEVPIDPDAKSVEILRDDEALVSTPGGARRALIALGTKLPLYGAVRGPSCTSRWLLVGPLAYVCADKVRLSREPPSDLDTAPSSAVPSNPSEALPYKYFFVGRDGGDAYATLHDAEDETPTEQLERGWSIAGVGEVVHGGITYVKTRRGRFVPRSQLGAVAAFGFHGETVEKSIDFGWILPDRANVWPAAKAVGKPSGVRTRLQRIEVRERARVGKEDWLRIDDGAWIRAVDARVPTPSERPAEVLAEERWIDVDTSSQTLVAYEGDRPVFATVVSTGRAATPTPKGTFRIWVKLRSATMSNADEAESADATPYSIEDVPWVQYFENGVALHAAFWHRKFGNVTSHGCVNLAPLDAQRLFGWTLPRAPRSWDAVFPTVAERSTVVRVR